MLRLTGEQFTTYAKVMGLRFDAIVSKLPLEGNMAVFQNNQLQVTQAVFDCMVDEDTIHETLLSLDIVMLKTVDMTEFMPIPAVDVDQINLLFGIQYGWSVRYSDRDITKGLHGEDLPFVE